MSGNLKTLGVALCAVLALTAVVASAALAANYTASSYPTTGTAESALGNDVFTTEAGKVECKSHFEGTLTEASSSLTVKAKYTECKAFGFLSATVSMGSCDYLSTAPTALGAHEFTTSVDVKCTNPSSVITITAGNCHISINEQSTGGHQVMTIHTPSGDVTFKTTATGIRYIVVVDGSLCPFNGTGEKTGATYTQGSSVTFDSTNGATIDIG